MISLFLISLAAVAGIGAGEPVVITDKQVVMHLGLAGYDLNKPNEKQRLRRKIVWAAGKVCNASIPGAIQVELYACMRSTIDDAHRQLDFIAATHLAGAPTVPAIAVAAVLKSK